MKVTIGDLYDELGKRIKENDDWYRDLFITHVECSDFTGVVSNVKPENKLLYLSIIAQSKNGDYTDCINNFDKKEK